MDHVKSAHITQSAAFKTEMLIFFSEQPPYRENNTVAMKFAHSYYMLITLHYLELPSLSTTTGNSVKPKHTVMIKGITKYGFYSPRLNIY